MSALNQANKTVNKIDDLFGEPSLIIGEDKERYLRLRAAVEADIKPKNVFDWIMVREQTDKYWEELRYKRGAAALIDGAFQEALESCLPPIARLKLPTSTIGHKYFSADTEAKKEAAAFLEKHGVTMEQIQAKAMQIVGGALQMLDRMIINRETSRRILRKENERRLSATDNASAPSDPARKVGS